MSGRPDRLRLGDVVRFDGDSHEIVGFDGAAAILSTPAGRTSVVTIAAPLGDASFEVLHLWAHRSAAPSKRELWDTTITEILAGYQADAAGKRPPESLYGSVKVWAGPTPRHPGGPLHGGADHARPMGGAGPHAPAGCAPPSAIRRQRAHRIWCGAAFGLRGV